MRTRLCTDCTPASAANKLTQVDVITMPWFCSSCENKNLDALDRCRYCNSSKPSPLLPSRVAAPSRASGTRVLAELCTYCRAARVTLFCEQCRTATCSTCDAAHHRTREKHSHSRVQHSDGVGTNRPPPPPPALPSGSLFARASPAPAAASRSQKPISSSGGEQWPCATCTFVNEPTSAACGMCGVYDTGERPEPPSPVPLRFVLMLSVFLFLFFFVLSSRNSSQACCRSYHCPVHECKTQIHFPLARQTTKP